MRHEHSASTLSPRRCYTASVHLQVLREGGLVVSRRAGRSIHYRLAAGDVAGLVAQLCRVAEAHRPEVSHEAVRLLSEHGFDAVLVADGVLEWQASGIPLSTATIEQVER